MTLFTGTSLRPAISGPASATDNAVVRFDGTTGKVLQNSNVTIDDSGNMIFADGTNIQTDEVRARDGDGLKLYDDGGNGIFVEDGGAVGIGTASPSGMLTIEKSHAFGTTEELFNAKFNANYGLRLRSNYAGAGVVKYEWKCKYGGTEYDVLSFLNGKVGIGTTSPDNRLTVDGDLDVTGEVGIGTSSPSEMFHMYSSTDSVKAVFEATSATKNAGFQVKNAASRNGEVQFWNDGQREWSFGAAESHFFVQEETAGTSVWTNRLVVKAGGIVGIGSSDSPAISDGNGLHIADKILRLGTDKTPSSEDDTGNKGEICWDADYIYVCTATNTWKRAAISTW